MDKKFVSEGKKVALVIDNCPAQSVFPPTEHNFLDSVNGPGRDWLTESTVP